jgi:hypothetical protein
MNPMRLSTNEINITYFHHKVNIESDTYIVIDGITKGGNCILEQGDRLRIFVIHAIATCLFSLFAAILKTLLTL